jgi:hypothetical protein
MRSKSVLIFMAAAIKPQVHGHGLVQGDQFQASVVDFDVHLVDLGFQVKDFGGEGVAPFVRAFTAFGSFLPRWRPCGEGVPLTAVNLRNVVHRNVPVPCVPPRKDRGIPVSRIGL